MRSLIATCLLAAWLSPTLAQDSVFNPNPRDRLNPNIEEAKPWQERATRLPPWPKNADLVELHLDGPQGPFRYFVDAKHLDVGPDEVVRYTLVAEGRNGTRNLSFEGIRCTPKGQYKVFAYGVAGHFSPFDGVDWQRISELNGEPYRFDLWRFHFCTDRGYKPLTKEEMIRSLKRRPSSSQRSGSPFL